MAPPFRPRCPVRRARFRSTSRKRDPTNDHVVTPSAGTHMEEVRNVPTARSPRPAAVRRRRVEPAGSDPDPTSPSHLVDPGCPSRGRRVPGIAHGGAGAVHVRDDRANSGVFRRRDSRAAAEGLHHGPERTARRDHVRSVRGSCALAARHRSGSGGRGSCDPGGVAGAGRRGHRLRRGSGRGGQLRAPAVAGRHRALRVRRQHVVP